MVVLPQPGGPHRISEESLRTASMRPSGPSGPSRCSCPRMSPSALGRRRSASGVGASEAKSSAMVAVATLAELDGLDHAVAGEGDAVDAGGHAVAQIGDGLDVLAVDRRHHVAAAHEAAGIGARL